MVAQKYNKIFFTYLSPELDEALRALAKHREQPVTALIREILKEYLTGNKLVPPKK